MYKLFLQILVEENLLNSTDNIEYDLFVGDRFRCINCFCRSL